jgi:hypothetical protein
MADDHQPNGNVTKGRCPKCGNLSSVGTPWCPFCERDAGPSPARPVDAGKTGISGAHIVIGIVCGFLLLLFVLFILVIIGLTTMEGS